MQHKISPKGTTFYKIVKKHESVTCEKNYELRLHKKSVISSTAVIQFGSRLSSIHSLVVLMLLKLAAISSMDFSLRTFPWCMIAS